MTVAAPSRNADPAELAKFSALAHHWWDPTHPMFGTLHKINPLRLSWIEAQVGGLAGKRIVDVGCGGGILAEGMAERGAQVLGIDLSEKSVGVAKLHKLESGTTVEYRFVAAEDLAREMPGAFDVVTCMEMIEHVPDQASIVAACARLMRPGGTLVMSTINRNPKSYLFAILGAEYVLRLLPRGTHDWSRFVRPAELAGYARRVGLDLVGTIGLVYNPFSRTFRLEPGDTDVNYFAAFAKHG